MINVSADAPEFIPIQLFLTLQNQMINENSAAHSNIEEFTNNVYV